MTAKERTFVREFSRNGDAPAAAAKAGYAHPGVKGYAVLMSEPVRQTIKDTQRKLLEDEILPLAVAHLADILGGRPAKDADRNSAAKLVLDYTLGAKASGGRDKAPEDMTPDELSARIGELRTRQLALADAAQVVDVAPEPPESDVFG